MKTAYDDRDVLRREAYEAYLAAPAAVFTDVTRAIDHQRFELPTILGLYSKMLVERGFFTDGPLRLTVFRVPGNRPRFVGAHAVVRCVSMRPLPTMRLRGEPSALLTEARDLFAAHVAGTRHLQVLATLPDPGNREWCCYPRTSQCIPRDRLEEESS